MMETMTRITLTLRPLDTLFFRDGRPFEAASDARGGLPQPQTLWGAMMTHVLAASGLTDWRQWKTALKANGNTAPALEAVGLPTELAELRVRGPWLTLSENGGRSQVLLPVPVNLVWTDEQKQEVHRLDPLPAGDLPPGWEQLEPQRRPLWARRTSLGDPVSGYVTLSGMQRYLDGSPPPPETIIDSARLLAYEKRVGIGINAQSQSVEEGLLYTISMLALQPCAAFYAELELPDSFNSDHLFDQVQVLPWGGEGRRVEVKRADPVNWPAPPKTESGKSCYVLTTPGLFSGKGSVAGRDNWRPDIQPDGARFVSTAVPGSGAVSGWDLVQGGPKPTRFTVPAGCVYYYENDHTDHALPGFSSDAAATRQGYGLVLKGVWNDA